MKECAAQAEKVVAERDRRSVAFGGHGSDGWSNHFSPKYNRCFVKLQYLTAAKDAIKGSPNLHTYLMDAFERTDIAIAASGPSAELQCRNDENPKECEKGALIMWEIACRIDGEQADCKMAQQFIDERMRN